MKEFFLGLWKDLKGSYLESDRNAFVVLIYSTVVLMLYCYFGSAAFFMRVFPSAQNAAYLSVIYQLLSTLVFFLLFGCLFLRFGMKKRLKNFGLSLGEKDYGARLLITFVPLLLISALLAALDGEMAGTYPMILINSATPIWQIALYFAAYFVYIFCWEFMFRGVLFFGIEKRSGAVMAIAVTTLASTLILTCIGGFGKPLIETAATVLASLCYAVTAFKTRSVYYGVVMHSALCFAVDLFILLLH